MRSSHTESTIDAMNSFHEQQFSNKEKSPLLTMQSCVAGHQHYQSCHKKRKLQARRDDEGPGLKPGTGWPSEASWMSAADGGLVVDHVDQSQPPAGCQMDDGWLINHKQQEWTMVEQWTWLWLILQKFWMLVQKTMKQSGDLLLNLLFWNIKWKVLSSKVKVWMLEAFITHVALDLFPCSHQADVFSISFAQISSWPKLPKLIRGVPRDSIPSQVDDLSTPFFCSIPSY